jgi:hypothetical protein
VAGTEAFDVLSLMPPFIEDRAPRDSAFRGAMMFDADVFRAYLEIISMLAPPEEVLARPGLTDRIMAAAGRDVQVPGPSRAELLKMLA